MFRFTVNLMLLVCAVTSVAGAQIGSLDHVKITTEPEGHSQPSATNTPVIPEYFNVEDPEVEELTDTLREYLEYPEMSYYVPTEEKEETIPEEITDLSELAIEQLPEEIEEDVTSVCETKDCLDILAKFASWKESRHDDSKPGSGRWG